MVRHHQKEQEKGYKRNIVINAVGSVATFIVLLIVGDHEVHERRVGAARRHPASSSSLFKAIHRHYTTVADGPARSRPTTSRAA